MAWSLELEQKLNALTAKQRQGIIRIVTAEAQGVSLARLLKTTYSCRWCGVTIGVSGQTAADRKARLATHEVECQTKHDHEWSFVTNTSGYYGKQKGWLGKPAFVEALALARHEALSRAHDEALRILQYGAPLGAGELVRQISEAEKDGDRRMAATAVLDRVNLGDQATGTRDPLRAKSDEDLEQEIADLEKKLGK